MVVTANRTEAQLKHVSQNITVFTQTHIRDSGATSVTDLLAGAGIQVYNEGAAGYGNEGVVIRGGRTSMHGFDLAGDILVLVDGHRTGSDFLGNIGLDNVQRIEVIRGPGAVQYGAAAMGGVINIISRRGETTPRATVETGTGSWGEQRYKAAISGRQGPVDISLGTSYQSRDNYELGNGETYENSDYKDRIRYHANLGWQVNDHHRLGLVVQGADTRDAGKGEDAAKSYHYYTRQERNNYGMDLSWEGMAGETDWLARYFQGEVDYDLARFTKTSSTQLPLSQNDNAYKGAQIQVSPTLGRLDAVVGMDWMQYDLNQRQDGDAASSSKQNTSRSDYANVGGFILGQFHLLDNLTLSGGLRYDAYDVSVNAHKIKEDVRVSRDIDKDSWTPSLGLAYSPVECLKLRANYAKAFKMPLPRQLTGYTVMMSTPFVGNPDLKPEKSDNFDLGLDLDWRSLFMSATWFYSDYTDMIGYETHTTADAHYNGKHYWYYNVESAEIQGIELGMKWDAAKTLGYDFQLTPQVNWTHLIVFEDGNGNKLPDRAQNSLGAGVTLGLEKLGFTGNLKVTYHGSQYEVDRTSGTSTTVGDSKLKDVGDTWVTDLNFSQRLGPKNTWGSLFLKGELHNLFDEHYANDEDSWMPGRSWYLGLEYRY